MKKLEKLADPKDRNQLDSQIGKEMVDVLTSSQGMSRQIKINVTNSDWWIFNQSDMTTLLSKALSKYLNTRELSDVSFIIQKQKFYAHKLILSARSTYFANLITLHCKDNSPLEIEIEDAAPSTFYSILEFMYTDQTKMTLQNFWEIYKAAKFYQLQDLVQVSHTFMTTNIDSRNIFDIWKASQLNNSVPIAEICIQFAIQTWKNEIGIKTLSPYDNVEQIEKLCRRNSIETFNLFSTGTPFSEQRHSFQWENQLLPPTAFPTPESIATFPQFFKVPSEPNVVSLSGTTLNRRLSVVSDNTTIGNVVQYVISCTTKLLNADRTSLFLYDKDTDELYSQVASVGEVVRIQSGDEGIVGTTFKSGKIQTENTNGKSGFGEVISRFVICSPVMRRDKVIGVVEVLNKAHNFTKQDETTLKTITELVSLLLDEVQNLVKKQENVLEEDFNLTDLLDKRNSIDFKLPNEEQLDTSFQTYMRGFSVSEEPLQDKKMESIVTNTSSTNTPLTPSLMTPETKELTFIAEEFDSNDKRKKRKKVETVPFMHFRIPRYELQFIQFEKEKKAKK